MSDVRKKIIYGLVSVSMFFAFAVPAQAQYQNSKPQATGATLEQCPDGRGACTLIDNPLASRGTDIYRQVGGVIGYVLLLIGSLTLLMIVWGGFQWLTAAGNAEKIEQGSKTMMWAVLGVVAVFVSYIFLNNFLDYITGAK